MYKVTLEVIIETKSVPTDEWVTRQMRQLRRAIEVETSTDKAWFGSLKTEEK